MTDVSLRVRDCVAIKGVKVRAKVFPFGKGEAVKKFINPRGGLVKRIFLIDLRDSIGYE